MLGGLLAGPIERRLGAGRATAMGWGLAGVCTVGIAASVWLPVTMVLEFAVTFGFVVAAVSSGAIIITSVPEEYRGRVFGIVRGLGVVLIPASALTAGWIAELVEIWIMFIAGGVFILMLALAAWANPHLRAARI